VTLQGEKGSTKCHARGRFGLKKCHLLFEWPLNHKLLKKKYFLINITWSIGGASIDEIGVAEVVVDALVVVDSSIFVEYWGPVLEMNVDFDVALVEVDLRAMGRTVLRVLVVVGVVALVGLVFRVVFRGVVRLVVRFVFWVVVVLRVVVIFCVILVFRVVDLFVGFSVTFDLCFVDIVFDLFVVGFEVVAKVCRDVCVWTVVILGFSFTKELGFTSLWMSTLATSIWGD
jgi:hypothetical protein